MKTNLVNWKELDQLVLDFETHYGTKYSLTQLTYMEYMFHEKFYVQGFSYSLNNSPPVWVSAKDVSAFLSNVNWANTNLICHNTHFDASILFWKYDIQPAFYMDTMLIGRVLVPGSASLDALTKVFFPHDKTKWKGKELVQFKDVKYLDDKQEGIMAGYCNRDVYATRELCNAMLPLVPELELQVMDMTLRMAYDKRVQCEIPTLEESIAEEAAKKELYIMAYTREALASNNKFADLLRSFGIDPPMKESPSTGKMTYAFSKKDKGFVDLQRDPVAAPICEARLAVKSTIAETRAQRFIDCMETLGYLPVFLNYSGARATHRWCMPGNAEVLTENGWVQMQDYKQGMGVMQYHKSNGTLSFDYLATMNHFPATTEHLVKFDTKFAKGLFTQDHKCLVATINGNGKKTYRDITAGEIKNRHATGIVVNGNFIGQENNLLPKYARLLVMIQADGYLRLPPHKDGGVLRFGFKKERKIERCIEILNQCDIPFSKTLDSEGSTRIVIAAANVPDIASKEFGDYLLWMTPEAREAFLDELSFWDGSFSTWRRSNNKGISYGTTSKNNAEWVATIAHISGRAATVNKVDRADEKWNDYYTVWIRDNLSDFTTLYNNKITEETYNGDVYCPTVSTGYFLVRYDGVIHVTGNSGGQKLNIQNMGRGSKLRESIKAPHGFRYVVCDLSQIEVRVLAWLTGNRVVIEAFKNGIDPYIAFGADLFNVIVANVTKAQRQEAKAAVLSLGFQAGPESFRNVAETVYGVKLTPQRAQEIVNIYRRVNFKVKQAWDDGQELLIGMANDPSLNYKFTNDVQFLFQAAKKPSGLYLNFDNLHYHADKEDSKKNGMVYGEGRDRSYIYGGKLIQNLTQSIARDIIAWQMVEIKKQLNMSPVCSVHDELWYITDESIADETYDKIQAIMCTSPDWFSGVPLEAEGGVGVYYADIK